MDTQTVLLSVMDSAKAPIEGTVQVDRLSPGRRLGRALVRWLLVSLAGGVVALLPLLHVCGALTLVVAAPVAGAFVYRRQVLLGAGQVPCPKCLGWVPVAAGAGGWPLRLHCGACGSTLVGRPPPA